MSLDDIINLAEECGLLINSNDRSSTSNETSFLVEDCYFDIERFVELIRADEREVCAKVCEDFADGNKWSDAHGCADTIRARNKI